MDYYRILQIDSHADQEIIEVAYKRLAKKYHPDVCHLKDCLSIMSRINEAYSVLRNVESRRSYDKNRLSHSHGFSKSVNYVPKDLPQAIKCLKSYLDAIKGKDFTHAYHLLNQSHKAAMSLSVFKNWQNFVAKVYTPLEFNITFVDIRQELDLENGYSISVLTFEVEVIEYNHIMEQTEKDHFYKQVFVSNNQARIHLNHEEVAQVSKRFEKLAKLKSRKWQNESKSLKFRTRTQYSLFLTSIEMEIERFSRYNIPFSLVFLNIKRKGSNSGSEIVSKIQNTIHQNIRKLDKCTLIDKNTFLVLLPGTRLMEGSSFAEKICWIILENPELEKYYFTIRRTVIENEVNNVDAFKKMIQNERNHFTKEDLKHT